MLSAFLLLFYRHLDLSHQVSIGVILNNLKLPRF